VKKSTSEGAVAARAAKVVCMSSPTQARVPRFASDVVRGTVAMIPAIVLTFVVEIVLIATTEITLGQLYATVILLFWAIYAMTVIFLTWRAFGALSPDELERRLVATAPPTGRGRRMLWALFGGGAVSWALTGSVIAVVAVVYLALNSDVASSPFVTWTAVAAIAASWAVTATAYAVRIARENAVRGGADFPGDGHPAFTEYIYLAVQIGTTFSSSDVSITSTRMRRVVTGNSIISFAFNTVIVALLVSVLITRIS
jgi:uncharacterized membrane protein